MTRIDLTELTAAHVTVSAGEPTAQALASAGDTPEALVVITDIDEERTRRAIAVVDRRGLALLSAESAPLRDLAPRLPPLVTIEVEADALDGEALLTIADTLSRLPDVPAMLLEREDGALSAISRARMAGALPLSLLSDDVLRGDARSAVQGARYVCGKCVPPSVHVSVAPGAAPPPCRRVWYHGPMDAAR